MESYKQEFIDFMVESHVLKFGEFTLKSGRKSPFFMNAGAYVTGSQLKRLGEYYAKAIHDKYGDDFDVLFGPAYKGIPLSVATTIAFYELYGKEIRYCSNRKEIKDHGDTGILRTINEFAETATVEFEDGRQAEYSFKQLEELELAYAVTIHKSQGSEYPAVILPILSGPRMLMNRNLLYTAVTRARKCVTVVGSETTFAEMIRNEKQQQRYSSLDRRIRELDESEQKESAIGEKGLS